MKIKKNYIENFRHKKGLVMGRKFLQKEVAEHVGVSLTTITLWASQTTQPSVENQAKLMALFGVEAEDLFDYET